MSVWHIKVISAKALPTYFFCSKKDEVRIAAVISLTCSCTPDDVLKPKKEKERKRKKKKVRERKRKKKKERERKRKKKKERKTDPFQF